MQFVRHYGEGGTVRIQWQGEADQTTCITRELCDGDSSGIERDGDEITFRDDFGRVTRYRITGQDERRDIFTVELISDATSAPALPSA